MPTDPTHDPPRIMVYPDPAYTLDSPNQVRMNHLASRRNRTSVTLILAGFINFILFAFTAWKPFPLLGIALLHIGAVIAFRRRPKLRCTTCQQWMQHQHLPSGSETEEFLICHPCRRYIYNHHRTGG